MSDRMSRESRSYTMSRIRAKGNASTELRVISIMRLYGIKGWSRHQNVIGKPDFLFRHEHLAVFVDGCFWHGCPKCFMPPQSNEDYWMKKIAGNRARDKHVTKELMDKGWKVIRLWEHSLKRPKWVANKLMSELNIAA